MEDFIRSQAVTCNAEVAIMSETVQDRLCYYRPVTDNDIYTTC